MTFTHSESFSAGLGEGPSDHWTIAAKPRAPIANGDAKFVDAAVDASISMRDWLIANYASLSRRLTRQVGCPDLACESLHEVWLKLGERRITDAPQSAASYVYRAACNTAIDLVRARHTWRYASDQDSGYDQIADVTPGPQIIAEARSDLKAVAEAYERLPSRHRAVLWAIQVEERTRAEVAAQYGISLRNVDYMVRRAIKHCSAARA